VRSFYDPNPVAFWGYHTHDLELDFTHRKNLFYLVRDPVDTLYSEMSYKGISDFESHLDKYLENYSRHVVAYKETGAIWIAYEKLVSEYNTMIPELGEHIRHLHVAAHEKTSNETVASGHEAFLSLAPRGIEAVRQMATKERIDENTSDPNVIPKALNYSEKRRAFRNLFEESIYRYFNMRTGLYYGGR
jgi:hypothetical protein